MTDPTVNQTFKKAITFHREGKIDDAERLYRIILKIQPKHLDANNNLGIILEIKNRKARTNSYVSYKGSENANWMSRNMIFSGLVILSFLVLHFYDFWIPEIKIKFIDADWSGLQNGKFRYWEELHHKFHNIIRVLIYCVAFVFLGLHLGHGFQSAFQSAGFNNNKYTPLIKKIAKTYAILIPAGFIFIALFHYLTAH